MRSTNRLVGAVIALASLLVLPACIQVGAGGDPPPPIRRHALDAGSLESEASRALPAVGVHPFHGRERYDLRVVLRGPDGSIEFLEGDRWVEDPRHALTIAVTEMLGTGAFQSATDAGAGFETELVLEGHVLACDLVAGPDAWSALLRVRFDLADAEGRIVHSGTYDASRALPGASSEGLGAAMSANAAEVVRTALARWRERR